MREITLDALIDNIPRLTEYVDEYLDELDCPMKARVQIDVSIDELFCNIASYAYPGSVGQATVRADYADGRFTLTFIDRGVPYNPLLKEDPDTSLSVDERQIGGLGIFMVKKAMDGMDYEYSDGRNIVSVYKNF